MIHTSTQQLWFSVTVSLIFLSAQFKSRDWKQKLYILLYYSRFIHKFPVICMFVHRWSPDESAWIITHHHHWFQTRRCMSKHSSLPLTNYQVVKSPIQENLLFSFHSQPQWRTLKKAQQLFNIIDMIQNCVTHQVHIHVIMTMGLFCFGEEMLNRYKQAGWYYLTLFQTPCRICLNMVKAYYEFAELFILMTKDIPADRLTFKCSNLY